MPAIGVPMRAIALALLLLLVSPLTVLAQALPYHVDPGARDVVPNLAAVPAIQRSRSVDSPYLLSGQHVGRRDRMAETLAMMSGPGICTSGSAST